MRQLSTSSKELDCGGSETLVLAEKALGIKQGIQCIGEKAGMAGYSSKDEAILILNLTLDQAAA